MSEEARIAAEVTKDPTTFSILTYLWVFSLSILGGVVSFMRKVRQGNTRLFNVVELIGEVTTAAFAGVITFWLCEWSELAPLLTAALVGVSGHMGSRALFAFEQVLANKFNIQPPPRD